LLRKRGPLEQSTPHSSHRATPEVGDPISGMPTPRPAEESSPAPRDRRSEALTDADSRREDIALAPVRFRTGTARRLGTRVWVS
jgi:hypothetical protein